MNRICLNEIQGTARPNGGILSAILFLIFAIPAFCQQTTKKVEEHFKSGKLKSRYTVVRNQSDEWVRHGHYIEWYRNERKFQEFTYEMGKIVGPVKSFHENGMKFQEYTCNRDGEKEGRYVEWFNNGQKLQECTYKKGKVDGPYTSWYKNRIKYEECAYKDGELSGIYHSWYENGQKKIECGYVDGKLDGRYIIWFAEGGVEEERTYKNGIRIK